MKVQHFSTDKKEVMVSNGFPMAQRIFIDKRECLETVKLRNQFMAPSGTSILNSMPYALSRVFASTSMPIFCGENGATNNQSF